MWINVDAIIAFVNDNRGLFDGFYHVDAALRSVVWPPNRAKAGSDLSALPRPLTLDKIRYQ